jgi:hypothetical protein
MKQLLAVATFVVLVVGLAYAQTRSKNQPTVPIARRLAMNIGVVPVWLGMPQKRVEDELTKVGYTLIPPGDEPLVFENAGKTDARGIGQLVFRKGRLFHASRDWPSGEHSFESVFAALSNFVQDGSTACRLSAQPLMEPAFQMQRVWIDCGDRTLFLREEAVPGKFSGVSESIEERP